MNINRDNYEMYFMMYADNELSAAERNAVEQFVEHNQDLKAEMDLFTATTLPSDEITFIPKTLLYRNEPGDQSMEGKLLMHLDKELSKDEAIAVSEQIASVPAVKEEWDLLQKTKLDNTDIIEFKNKASLYRHEEARIVSIKWWRVAAAAVLIGGGLFTGVTVFNQEQIVDGTTGSLITSDKNNKVNPANKTIDQLPVNNTVTEEKKMVTSVIQQEDDKPVKKTITAVSTLGSNNTIAVTRLKKIADKGNEDIIVSPEKNILPQSNKTEELFVQQKRREMINDRELIANVEIQPKIKDISRPMIDQEISTGRNDFAKFTSEREGSNDRILYMDEDKLSRSKVGGFFRKVKRVVERNTRIQTSDGFRIGGFEFAVK